MRQEPISIELISDDYEESIERVGYNFGVSRRSFVQFLSVGLMVAASAPALAQRQRGRGGRRPANVAARLHFGKDGTITLLAGKVEAGQGARAELSLAAAEELRVSPNSITVMLADTSAVPDDGITAGSRSTPSTVPAVREAAAAARELLIELAAKTLSLGRETIRVREGKAIGPGSDRSLSYADLAATDEMAKLLEQPLPSGVTVTPGKSWKVLGNSLARPNGQALVTGAHEFPSDISRPGMLYGKVLRPASFGAKLTSIDLAPAKAMEGVLVIQDGDFVGVTAASSFLANRALTAILPTAKWGPAPHPSSQELFEHLRKKVHDPIPANPFNEDLARAKTVLRQSYHVAYAQHAPLEPRAAVAEWADNKLTVWTGTQNPFGVRSELARAFHTPEEDVRVVVPDFGGGYGGKHTGEAAVEAARLARGVGRPVSLRWTREEEFTWAYFRPAAVIDVEATLDGQGSLTSWYFINVNSGGSAIETPYRAGNSRSHFITSDAPLRQGSYRGLAATANTFARESFMDELAAAAGADPLAFRLAHLGTTPAQQRLRAVLETAAQRFHWQESLTKKSPQLGFGLACGTEKGSFVAACAEVEIDRVQKKIIVRRVSEVFECGAILNPDNLNNQVQGAIVMGLGPALREEMRFENGKMLNASFRGCPVPRFEDVPQLDIQLLDRPDLESVGAGETPIIAIAPAIGNAVFHATGIRLRSMPLRLPEV